MEPNRTLLTLCPLSVQVLEYTDANMGYDAATGNFTDMIKAGIIDPLKVEHSPYLNRLFLCIIYSPHLINAK
jgi:chaperonin GroEL (HSP60 family)